MQVKDGANMTKPKMTTAIATQMVEEIEALQAKIDAVYTRATLEFAGSNHAAEIRDAVKARKAAADEGGFAEGILKSFDCEDDDAG